MAPIISSAREPAHREEPPLPSWPELPSTAVSRGRCLWREPACQLPVSVSVGATDQVRGTAWPAGCRGLLMPMAGARRK